MTNNVWQVNRAGECSDADEENRNLRILSGLLFFSLLICFTNIFDNQTIMFKMRLDYQGNLKASFTHPIRSAIKKGQYMNKNSIQDLKSFPQTILKEVSGCVTSPHSGRKPSFVKWDWIGKEIWTVYSIHTGPLKVFPRPSWKKWLLSTLHTSAANVLM